MIATDCAPSGSVDASSTTENEKSEIDLAKPKRREIVSWRMYSRAMRTPTPPRGSGGLSDGSLRTYSRQQTRSIPNARDLR